MLKTKFFCGITPIVVISALRSPLVGVDLRNYIDLFQYFSAVNLTDLFHFRIEPGFVFFCKIIGCISSDSQFFVIATSILINFLIGLFIYRVSEDVGESLFIFVGYYFLFYSFSAVRQYIAIAFAVNAYYYFSKNEDIKIIKKKFKFKI